MDLIDGITFFLTALLIKNIVLTQFLGLCSFFGVSNKETSALGMGLSVLFVIVLSSTVSYSIYTYVLVPNELEYLRTVIFILVISGFVQFIELFIKKVSPGLYGLLGIYLPLITTNCAVMGVALLNIDQEYNFIEMLLFSTATSLGYSTVIYIFSFIREQMSKSPMPSAVRGVPIALFTAGIMALTMSTFA
jgi:electron transport complex protein RnfA